MKPRAVIHCPDLPCQGVRTERFSVPDIDLDPAAVRILAITEAPPVDPADDFYAPGESFYLQTTREVFADAGIAVSTIEDILALGIYVTPAVKCAKVGNGLKIAPVRACSHLLEREMALFPNLVAVLALGDTAIKAVNEIARRTTGERAIPRGSTYKIRGGEFWFGDLRVFPSYLPTGKSILIEKGKRGVIAADLTAALALIDG